MKPLLLIVLLAIAGIAGYLYMNDRSGLMSAIGLAQTVDTKCITSDGRVIYGTLPEGQQCARVEPVDGAVTVLESTLVPEGEDETPEFTCDGRRYCSQMRSCDEANFFILNCPNVEIQSDSCIRRWCGY